MKKHFGMLVLVAVVAVLSFGLGISRSYKGAYDDGVRDGAKAMQVVAYETGNGMNVPVEGGGVKFYFYDRLADDRTKNSKAGIDYVTCLKECAYGQWEAFRAKYDIDVGVTDNLREAYKHNVHSDQSVF